MAIVREDFVDGSPSSASSATATIIKVILSVCIIQVADLPRPYSAPLASLRSERRNTQTETPPLETFADLLLMYQIRITLGSSR